MTAREGSQYLYYNSNLIWSARSSRQARISRSNLTLHVSQPIKINYFTWKYNIKIYISITLAQKLSSKASELSGPSGLYYLFYDGHVYMQTWTLLTGSQCRISDTRVTIKACGTRLFHDGPVDMQVWYASTGMICKYDMQVLVWYASSGMICKYDMQVPVWYASMSPPDKKSVQSLQLLRPVSFFFVVEIWITDP